MLAGLPIRAVHGAWGTCQAFFVTDAGNLGRWAAAHTEYCPEQHAALACAVANFKGLRKRDCAAFVAAVEQAMMAAHAIITDGAGVLAGAQ